MHYQEPTSPAAVIYDSQLEQQKLLGAHKKSMGKNISKSTLHSGGCHSGYMAT
jgi:hypothetical protein